MKKPSGMVGRYMPNSGHGGCPGIRFMTIFGSHVDPHISNIGYMKVYEGGCRPWEVSHLFSLEISHRMPSESCLGTPWSPSCELTCKHIFLLRTFWVRPMVKKSVKNYIEWYYQSTKRLIVGQRYKNLIVISYYDIMSF